MRIAVDAFGGDNAPAAVVEGCIDALKKYPDMSVTLCGDEERIKAELEKYRYDVARVDILHAPEIISCDEQPTFAIRRKKDSSLVKAMELVRRGIGRQHRRGACGSHVHNKAHRGSKASGHRSGVPGGKGLCAYNGLRRKR